VDHWCRRRLSGVAHERRGYHYAIRIVLPDRGRNSPHINERT
jgi:hypothetical protein